MAPEQREQDRAALVLRLERELQDAAARLRKASQDHSVARGEKRDAEARLFRAQSPPDASNFCLMCWVNHQMLSRLRLVPNSEGRLSDRWMCEAANCGHSEDRRTSGK
ncbi:MAG TPA: hypothetical protein VKQ70_02250 [Caulobacteraceae bacterium]|nr:hypothetical protein [Caulobacteraceae bacterium]